METKEQSILSAGLPKWPALAVEGKPVTKEQAAEIIVRTDCFSFSCNDESWPVMLWEAIGLKSDRVGPVNWDDSEAAMKRLRRIELEYLCNARIASAWIGGPHGWCNWDGTIGCNNYNIGKWPSCEAVHGEWALIAAAFPFLDLRCQLFNGENCEDHSAPVIEFRVHNGAVESLVPATPMRLAAGTTESDVLSVLYSPSSVRERGCTIEQFKWALKLAEG